MDNDDWHTESEGEHVVYGGLIVIELIEVDFSKIKAVIQKDMDEDFKHFYMKQVAKTMQIAVCMGPFRLFKTSI